VSSQGSCLAASGARAAGGAALRVGLPLDDLGFGCQRLSMPAGTVPEPARRPRFPWSVLVIAGFVSACPELPVTAGNCLA
jgi:hypothetical protein